MWFPYNTTTSPNFELTYFLLAILVYYTVTVANASDLSFVGFTIQIRAEFEILERKICRINELILGENGVDGGVVNVIKDAIVHHQRNIL